MRLIRPIMVSWSGARTPIISCYVLHQYATHPATICDHLFIKWPLIPWEPIYPAEKPSASNLVAIEPERGWGANPPTLFNNSAPGSPLPLQTPVPAPGPRPAAHYMGSLAASTGKPQLLQGSTKPSRQPSNKKLPLTNHSTNQPTNLSI